MSGTRQTENPKPRIVACLALVLTAVITGFGQTSTNSFEVSGVVLDPNGAVIAEAAVTLRHQGRSVQTKTTSEEGRFRFTRLTTGNYEIEVQKGGFKPIITNLTLDAKPAAPLQIVLPVAELREEIAVGGRANQVNTNPDENLDVIKLDHEALKDLPVLGNDVIARDIISD